MKKIIFSVIFAILVVTGVALSDYFPDVIVTSPNGIWTDTRAYSTIDAAITAIGANERDLYVISQETTTALTIPSNINLHFRRNGSIANTGQLTLQTTSIDAPNKQIFTGTGNIDFADGTVLKTGWFSNVESAFALTTNDTVTLIVSKAQTITADYSPGNNVNLKWESPGNILTIAAGREVGNLKNIEAGNFQILAGSGDYDFLDGTRFNLAWVNRLRTIINWVESEYITVVVPGTNSVDFTDTTPENMMLDFASMQGQFSVAIGVTLSINSPDNVIANPRQIIFDGGGTVSFVNPGRLSVVWYADSGLGTTASRWSGALQNAFDANKSDFQYYCPGGEYEDTSTITLDADDTNRGGYIISGDGPRITRFYYNQTDDTSLLKLEGDAGASTLSAIGINNVGFYGEETATGAAVEMIDVTVGDFHDIYISEFNQDNTHSAGFWTKGRDRLKFARIQTYKVLKSYHIDINPNHATIDADLFTFTDNSLSPVDADNGYGWYVDADNLYSFKINGENVVPQCKVGFYWNADTAASVSEEVNIEGLRTEQGDTTNKDCWLIYIYNASKVNTLNINDCRASTAENGIFVDGVRTLNVVGTILAAGAGYYSIDSDTNTYYLNVRGSFLNSSATFEKPAYTALEYKYGSDYHIASYNYADNYVAIDRIFMDGALMQKAVTLTYSATMTPNLDDGNSFYITVTDGNAFAINAATGGYSGQQFTITIYNNSGGALGADTWAAQYRFSGGTDPTMPANGNFTSVHFVNQSGQFIASPCDDCS